MKFERIDEAYLNHLKKDIAFAKKCVDDSGPEDGLSMYFEIENGQLNHLFPNLMTAREAAASIVAAADRYVAVRDSALEADKDLTDEDVRAVLVSHLRESEMNVMEAMRYVAVLRVLYEHLGAPNDGILSESDIQEELSYMLCFAPDKSPEEHLDDLIVELEPAKLNGFMRFANNARFVEEVMRGTEEDRRFWDERIERHCLAKEEIAICAAVIYNQVTCDPDGDVSREMDPGMLTAMLGVRLDTVHMEAAVQAGKLKKHDLRRWKKLAPYIFAAVIAGILMGAVVGAGGYIAMELIYAYMFEAGVTKLLAMLAAVSYFLLIGSCGMYTLMMYLSELYNDYQSELGAYECSEMNQAVRQLHIEKDPA